MRLCAHIRLSIGIGKHHRRNGVLKGTYLTPEGMLSSAGRLPAYHAYTTKRKHKCSSSFLKFADFIDKDSYRNAFLAYNFRSRKSVQRYKHFLTWQNKNELPPRGNLFRAAAAWVGNVVLFVYHPGDGVNHFFGWSELVGQLCF